ncbi:hypothetical protein OPAG_06911 [Rhodococcus opacus PD630]|uniref:DoxX family protein n=1 Tax=Rhodococcus opacus TaxID=37919 RepID=UPI00029CCC0E|nr:DoxX family protein [Rhodococcus opacus]EHI43623.1 hypothetical protein OPAG_06911 [Rhodococcus opacus PD630]UDH01534.1 DoxX family protein [Rhodococcus opacus PD630]
MSSLDVGLAILRLAAGLTLAAHGYQKVFAGGRIGGTGRWFDSIGMRPGRVHAAAAASTELVAGALLALGFLTVLAGAAFVAVMLVAAWTVHRKKGFYSVNSGWEYNFILAVIGVVIATSGPGAYSIDYVLGISNPLSGGVGFLVAVGGGIVAGAAQIALFYRPPAAQSTS